jgi:hypothetical protein
MIIQGLIIVLVVLVIANVALGVYNTVSPPCGTAEEFFRGAKLLPDGASASLGSIPTSADRYFLGAKAVATGIPGVIGLTSHNYVKGTDVEGNDREGYINPVVFQMAEDESDCGSRMKADEVSDEARKAIKAMFPGSSVNESDLPAFSAAEGMFAKSKPVKQASGKNMSLAHKSARDGYSDSRQQSQPNELEI